MQLRLSKVQYNLLRDATKELANFFVAALVFGFVFATSWKPWFPFLGAAIYFGLMSLSLFFAKKGE